MGFDPGIFNLDRMQAGMVMDGDGCDGSLAWPIKTPMIL